MISQLDFRSHFSSLGDRLYFNHASYAPLSDLVVKSMDQLMKIQMEGSPQTWEVATDHLERLRSNYAKLIHTTPDRIALTGNTGSGLSALANGIKWNRGDHILIYEYEFPANVVPFYNLRKLGVEVELVRCSGGRVTAEIFESRLRPTTRLITLSSVQYSTGYQADLQSFSTLCHAKGIIFCLDAIQSLGAIPMDVTKLGVDFLSAGAYKWMMAPIGTGFLYLTDEMQEMLEVAGLGYMGTQNPEEYKDLDQPLHADARRFEVGAFPTPGVAGARAALDLILNCGIENVQLHIDNLIHRFETGLEFTEFLPLYSFSKEERSGIFMFTHKDKEKNSEICDNLDARNVNIALRDGVLRFSPHYHNSAEQVDKFLEMLSDFR